MARMTGRFSMADRFIAFAKTTQELVDEMYEPVPDMRRVRDLISARVCFHEALLGGPGYKAVALGHAACSGHKNIVEALVDAGASIDERGYGNESPLELAALFGHRDIAQYLISKGADLNLVDNGGQTALILAVSREQPDVATLLLEAKADITVRDNDGKSAYDHGVEIAVSSPATGAILPRLKF